MLTLAFVLSHHHLIIVFFHSFCSSAIFCVGYWLQSLLCTDKPVGSVVLKVGLEVTYHHVSL